ncbi:MAG: zinc-binding dehydrogenase [Planctomycetota bacterium]
MRAIVIPKNGPPEVFEEREVEERRLTPVDVRVEVAAAGVNFADVMGRVGLYPDAPPLPYAPGYEIAGTVVEAGERAAERLPPGTRVMAVTRFGGYADLVRVPEHAAVPLADHVPFDVAAGTPVNYLTAWLGLVHMGNAKAGESVLVHGGAGGVGLAVIDLARGRDLVLHATSSSAAKRERLLELGVAAALDGTAGDFEDQARRATRGRGYDLVLDPQGPESFQRSLKQLAPLGRLVCYGFSSLVTGPKRKLWHAVTSVLKTAKVNPITLMNQNVGVLGLNLAHLFTERELQRTAMAKLGDLLDRGEIRPHIDRTFPFTAAGAAASHTYLHERKNFGKLVLVKEGVAPTR